MANNTTTAVSTLAAVIDEVIRASDFVPLPDNRQELDTPGLGLSYFLIAFNVISSVGGTLGNILTLLIVIIRSVKYQTHYIIKMADINLSYLSTCHKWLTLSGFKL